MESNNEKRWGCSKLPRLWTTNQSAFLILVLYFRFTPSDARRRLLSQYIISIRNRSNFSAENELCSSPVPARTNPRVTEARSRVRHCPDRNDNNSTHVFASLDLALAENDAESSGTGAVRAFERPLGPWGIL